MTRSAAAPSLGRVSPVHRPSRVDARRVAVQAQLLDAERPARLPDLVHHLSMLRLDPIAAVAPSADDWRVLGEGACTFFRAGSFAEGLELVRAIGQLPDLDPHHPDVDIRHDGVTVRLITITDDTYGLSGRDVELARQISAVARELNVPADPSNVQTFQLAIDALVRPDILPFWRAVLGYRDRDDGGEDLLDPRGRGPLIWFQDMDEPRPQRNRLHVDVWVPHDQAETAGRGRDRSRRPSRYRPVRFVVVDPGRR